MRAFLRKYKYIIFTLLSLYLLTNIIRTLFNIYSLLLFIIIIVYIYKNNKKLFKKFIYKIIYKNKLVKIDNKFVAAKKSLLSIAEAKSLIKNRVNLEVINIEKRKIEQKLNYGNYNVILFGAGSSGKTSIARVILRRIVGETSPTIGTTKNITSYKVNIPLLKRQINIIDTPGLFESSIQGKRREEETISRATNSDLIIFVIDQDLNKYELYLIKELSRIGKSIIIALNKCDLRTESQNKIIKNNIIKITSEISSCKVIETVAYLQKSSRVRNSNKNMSVDVDNLFSEIINTLDSNGEELLADNILFQCNKLGTISKQIINNQRRLSSQRIINKYSWITCGVIAMTPLPAIDLIATSTVNVQMIIEISQIYGVKMRREEASKLTKSIINTLLTLGIVKGGLSVISNILSVNFTTSFVTKFIQSITSAWIIKLVGFSFIEYFEQNQSWGDGGIQKVVQKIYDLNRREKILKDFIDEAVKKIKEYKFDSKQKKLPPQYPYD